MMMHNIDDENKGETQNISGDDAEIDAETESSTAKKTRKSKKKKSKALSAPISESLILPQSTSSTLHPEISAVVAANSFEAKMQNLFESLAKQGIFEPEEEDKSVLKPTEEYTFWKTQPVPKTEEIIVEDGVIEVVDRDQIRQTPYDLISQFEWSLVDVNDEAQVRLTNLRTQSQTPERS
ncbi:glycylpeptide N-tetradecanoyltransferase [Physocladia obscura]|uniref:Glycylpeptide N-tetradecanoyltransferase n=1 Tax=Physocladia obscura TaxID=109957 RepID=A0AAD5ST40_9FUNG|nr:glycylpeptide N-tetradecanoyltransferase [Physocladia obscura]